MRNALIALSTVLVLLSPAVYVYSIVKGETRPHRTTRFVLLVICILSTWSLLEGRTNAAFWLSAASLVQALAVFILCLKWGYGGWAKLDMACLVVALTGIVVWQITDKALLGLFAAILADVIGVVPTFIKTYKLPHTENWQFFAIDTFAAILSILALKSYDLYAISYPIYILLVNGAMVWLILWRTKAIGEAHE